MAEITPDQEKTLYALGFLYIAASHATDSELTQDEMRTVAARVEAWQPGLEASFVASALKKSMTLYRSFEEGEAKEYEDEWKGVLKVRCLPRLNALAPLNPPFFSWLFDRSARCVTLERAYLPALLENDPSDPMPSPCNSHSF